MAGNSRKDLVLQWKNLFKLFPTLKLQWQNREGDGGKHGKIACVLISGNKWASVGHTQLVWVTLHFWSEKTKDLHQFYWFNDFFPHTTLWQIHSCVVPAASLAPQQPGQQPYSSMLQGCTSKLCTVLLWGSISSLLLQKCRKVWKKKSSLL